MVVALLASTYMLFDPAQWLFKLMKLTNMNMSHKLFLLALAMAGFVVSYVAEVALFSRLAKLIGILNDKYRPKHRKQRKQYKIVLESMRF